MNLDLKKTVKFAAGVCAALSVVAIASVAASSAAVKVVAAGLRAAKDTMKEQLDELKSEPAAETITPVHEEVDLVSDAAAAEHSPSENE